MLQIRNSQLIVLREECERRYVRDAALFLRTNYPDQTESLSSDELEQFVRDGIRRATGYEIHGAVEIRQFLELMVIYGREFDACDETAWARKILTRAFLDGSEKIVELISQHQRQAIQ